MSLDWYGSKTRKESKYRTAVSNETILATRQETFFTKKNPSAKHYWRFIIGFLINAALLNFYFVKIYFFVKKPIFSNVNISVNMIL